MAQLEVNPAVVLGAGPYGLAVAAHLRPRRVPLRVFREVGARPQLIGRGSTTFAATGYRVAGAPRLDPHLGCTVPGLNFPGLPAPSAAAK